MLFCKIKIIQSRRPVHGTFHCFVVYFLCRFSNSIQCTIGVVDKIERKIGFKHTHRQMWENFTLYLFSYILVVIFQWYFKLWCNRPNGSVQKNSFGNRVLFCACFMSCRRYFLLLFFHYSRNFCVRLTVNHQIKTMSHSDNKTTHKNTSYEINTNQLHSNHTKNNMPSITECNLLTSYFLRIY